MYFVLKILTIFAVVNCVQMQSFGLPQFCRRDDVDDSVCSVIENFFGFTPFQQLVDLLAGALTASTNIFQIRDIISYITRSFGPNPLNTTNYESISKSFNFIIFHANSKKKSLNISSTDVLHDCDALTLNGNQVKLLWSGYGDNCYGANASEALLDWNESEMQRFADISNSTIIVVDWGFAGLSCYGYIQITLCLIGKVAEFFSHLLAKCLVIEDLEMIGHSMGAQFIGYTAQHLKSNGFQVKALIELDPAGPGYVRGLRCQGIQNNCAKYTMIFHSNPCQLGTCDIAFGDVNVLINPTRSYCQPGCTCFLNPGCSHSYVNRIFLALTQKTTLLTTYTYFYPYIPGWGETATLTIYENMKPGYYILNTYT